MAQYPCPAAMPLSSAVLKDQEWETHCLYKLSSDDSGSSQQSSKTDFPTPEDQTKTHLFLVFGQRVPKILPQVIDNCYQQGLSQASRHKRGMESTDLQEISPKQPQFCFSILTSLHLSRTHRSSLHAPVILTQLRISPLDRNYGKFGMGRNYDNSFTPCTPQQRQLVSHTPYSLFLSASGTACSTHSTFYPASSTSKPVRR